jgi:hypothetical protein
MKVLIRVDMCVAISVSLLVMVAVSTSQGCHSKERSVNQASNQRRADEPLGLLEKAASFELLSLDPTFRANKADRRNDDFHGWRILGRLRVEGDEKEAIAAALNEGVDESNGIELGCAIEPRHGIRVTDGDRNTDFLICFKCGQVVVLVGDTESSEFLTTASPRKQFDAILGKSQMPIAPSD